MTLHIKVVSPEKVIFEDDVDQVTAPTTTGEITILPQHISLVTQLDHGELIIKKGKEEIPLVVAGGFLEASNNIVSVLADYAVQSHEIDAIKAEEAKKAAEQLMSEKTSGRDFAQAQSIFRRAILELKIANRRKHRPNITG